MSENTPTRLKGETNQWFTPPHIMDAVRKVGLIGLDPCTVASNPTGAKVFYTAEDDGLTKDWKAASPDHLVFVNPPYSGPDGRPQMPRWTKKISEEASAGTKIIALLPAGARFSTRYFQADILSHARLSGCCWIRGRVAFVNETGVPQKGNPYDSVVYSFGVDEWLFMDAFKSIGAVWTIRT